MPALPEIAVDLGAAVAVIWIGGAVVIGGLDHLRARWRRQRLASGRLGEPSAWRPGPAQDL